MPLAITYSRASAGIDAPLVTVETHLSNGLPGFSIVGLPETAVKESRDRVRSALINSQFDFPTRRIIVNLAPADLPKEGGRFDLAIAIGVLAASEQLPTEKLAEYEFAGELALSGELRPIHGCLPFSLATKNNQRRLIVPINNANEAALPTDAIILAASHLLDVCHHLTNEKLISPHILPANTSNIISLPDLIDVCGQEHAKRALEIAAAGQHSMLMSGPPGTGKTMLASRLPGILPPMLEAESLEVAAINSLRGIAFDYATWRQRPFRAPHHSASSVALVGGGSPPKPGEISLSHNGILFLDELPEFNRHVLEGLREPLESGHVTISRAAYQAQFPAKFQLIATMNPCPCGYLTDKSGRCRCTPPQIARYQAKISGPLLDRIDIHVEVPRLPRHAFNATNKNYEPSALVRERVIHAREQQIKRANKLNTALAGQDLEIHCQLSVENKQFLNDALEKLGLSARAYHRILKIARTIADLDASANINTNHLAEALTYRKQPVIQS